MKLPVLLCFIMVSGIPAGSAQVLDHGMLANYPFTGHVLDMSGNDYDGTVYGAALTADRFGQSDNAYTFDGIDDYISIPWTVHDDFTISFWVNTTQTADTFNGSWWSGNGLIDGDVCGSYPDFGIALCEDKVAFCGMISSQSINNGLWHHILTRRTLSSGNGELFVDGELEATGPTTTSSLTAFSWLGVGNNPCDIMNNRRWFSGSIDDIRFYDRVITDTEIDTLFHENNWATTVEITEKQYPETFILDCNYPNPFNSSTTIEYTLPFDSDVLLTVSTITGQTIATIENAFHSQGKHHVTWDAHNFPSGIYIYTLHACNHHESSLMVVMK